MFRVIRMNIKSNTYSRVFKPYKPQCSRGIRIQRLIISVNVPPFGHTTIEIKIFELYPSAQFFSHSLGSLIESAHFLRENVKPCTFLTRRKQYKKKGSSFDRKEQRISRVNDHPVCQARAFRSACHGFCFRIGKQFIITFNYMRAPGKTVSCLFCSLCLRYRGCSNVACSFQQYYDNNNN